MDADLMPISGKHIFTYSIFMRFIHAYSACRIDTKAVMRFKSDKHLCGHVVPVVPAILGGKISSWLCGFSRSEARLIDSNVRAVVSVHCFGCCWLAYLPVWQSASSLAWPG